MKINLVGLATQAAAAIPGKRDHGGYAFMLEQLADHVRAVRRGEATLADFANLYGLWPEDAQQISTGDLPF